MTLWSCPHMAILTYDENPITRKGDSRRLTPGAQEGTRKKLPQAKRRPEKYRSAPIKRKGSIQVVLAENEAKAAQGEGEYARDINGPRHANVPRN
jgi:hypothetical protein